MIGCIGIGGVILVPALVFLANVPIHLSIPAAMMAYILSGLVATTVFARNKSIEWSMATWLCAGAIPTAFAGAWAANVLDQRILEIFLGLLTLLSGLNALKQKNGTEIPAQGTVSKKALGGVGAVTGFLSSLSGTGGPLVLVPILLSMRVQVLTAVGLSQAISASNRDCRDVCKSAVRQAGSGTRRHPGGRLDHRIMVRGEARACRSAHNAAQNRIDCPCAGGHFHTRKRRLAHD